MERKFVWTSASPRGLTLPPLVSTWADQLARAPVTEVPEEEIITEIEETDTGETDHDDDDDHKNDVVTS